MNQSIIDYAVDQLRCASSHMCASKRWTIVVIITISIQLYMNETFIFYKYDESFNFLWQFYNKFQLLNSHRYCSNILKVWWEIISQFIGNFLLFPFQWWKNLENRLRFDEVTSMSLVAPFFGTQCRWAHYIFINDLLIS